MPKQLLLYVEAWVIFHQAPLPYHPQHEANTYSKLYHLHQFHSMGSCETQLLEFVADIASTTQKGAQTDNLIMYFSKAFDKVGHARLVRKLHHYGIWGKTNKWIESFLANRKQTGVLEGEVERFNCHLWCTSRVCSRALPLPLLHKRHPQQHNIKSQTVCRRHCNVPHHQMYQGWKYTPEWSTETWWMGEEMADGILSWKVPGSKNHMKQTHHRTQVYSTEKSWSMQRQLNISA